MAYSTTPLGSVTTTVIPRCMHETPRKVETIDTVDEDGIPCKNDVMICMDCGLTWEVTLDG